MAAADEIGALFDQWNAALQTGDPDTVVALYAEDAILLPTLSNDVRHTQAERRDYFVDFLAKSPSGTINEANIRVIGETAINSGIYTFLLNPDDNPSEAHCRYTFVYAKAGGEWKIVEHHSSLMPN